MAWRTATTYKSDLFRKAIIGAESLFQIHGEKFQNAAYQAVLSPGFSTGRLKIYHPLQISWRYPRSMSNSRSARGSEAYFTTCLRANAFARSNAAANQV
jgi:hypothetical protein